MRHLLAAIALFLACANLGPWPASVAWAQAPELTFIADTLVVQADGTYESIQRIATLAAANGLKKEEISTGVLTVAPV